MGADPNRNFPSNERGGDEDSRRLHQRRMSDNDGCSDSYPGPRAFSEAESRAVRAAVGRAGRSGDKRGLECLIRSRNQS